MEKIKSLQLLCRPPNLPETVNFKRLPILTTKLQRTRMQTTLVKRTLKAKTSLWTNCSSVHVTKGKGSARSTNSALSKRHRTCLPHTGALQTYCSPDILSKVRRSFLIKLNIKNERHIYWDINQTIKSMESWQVRSSAISKIPAITDDTLPIFLLTPFV